MHQINNILTNYTIWRKITYSHIWQLFMFHGYKWMTPRLLVPAMFNLLILILHPFNTKTLAPARCNWYCTSWRTGPPDTWETCRPGTWGWSPPRRWWPPPAGSGPPRSRSRCGFPPPAAPSRSRAGSGSRRQSFCKSRWCGEECSWLYQQPRKKTRDIFNSIDEGFPAKEKNVKYQDTWGSAPAWSSNLVVDEHGNLHTSFVWKSSRYIHLTLNSNFVFVLSTHQLGFVGWLWGAADCCLCWSEGLVGPAYKFPA